MTGEKLSNERIVGSTQPKKGFWTHHILIESKKDINNELEALIKASYAFYLKRKALKDNRKPVKKKIK